VSGVWARSPLCGSSSSVTFPSLSPAGVGELYVGVALPYGGATGAGTTDGFVYNSPDGWSDFTYDTDVSSNASPTANELGGGDGSDTVGALLVESTGTTSTGGGGSPASTADVTSVTTLGTKSGHIGSDTTNLTVSPATVGDLEVLGVANDTWVTTVSSVSGGGVSQWEPATSVDYDSGDGEMLQFFHGW
jgi:hypothetical protein